MTKPIAVIFKIEMSIDLAHGTIMAVCPHCGTVIVREKECLLKFSEFPEDACTGCGHVYQLGSSSLHNGAAMSLCNGTTIWVSSL